MGSTKQDVKATSASVPARHSEEFKRNAVRLVIDEGYTFAAAAKAVGVSDQTLRLWRKKFDPAPKECGDDATLDELRAENQRLKRELRRAELEREILKKVAPSEAWGRGTSHGDMNGNLPLEPGGINSTRQSLASCRNRVLRGARATVAASVGSQSRSQDIEPRKRKLRRSFLFF